MLRIQLLVLISLLTIPTALSQVFDQRELRALRIYDRPKIDGKLDEAIWQKAEKATDFIQYEPYNGKDPSQQTQAMVAYDDNSFYIGAVLYDDQPEDIKRELGERDNQRLNADYFMVGIGPYNDGMNAFTFYVYASGVQMDIKLFSTGDDISWDAVWDSEVSITDQGWVVEMAIPYSAIRFSREEVQVWALNFIRNVHRNREVSSWNFIDKRRDGVVNQWGLLSGMKDIKPPVRLSFEPYLVTNLSKVPDNKAWEFNLAGGMDLKLGLSESFTLDMTLVPDFSQVQSDDIVVNLSPFETYYSEKRQFFTEGVELFSRGDVFYSRRVGSQPIEYEAVEEEYPGENIIENPEVTRLLNATKVSGRTSKGTGLGLFNAFTAPSYATVRDSTGEEKKILTQAFTNYSMLVFDQSLANNSFVSIYNTNVFRGKSEYSANVSGTELNFRDRKNNVSFWGTLNVSQKYYPDSSPDIGFFYDISLSKVSGKFNYAFFQKMETDNYDPNDLGYNSSNNEFSNGLYFEYNAFDPFWVILESNTELVVEYSQLYAPREFTELDIDIENHTLFKNILTVGLDASFKPFGTHDYFEPRNPGWFVKYPASYSFGAFYSPDYNKTFVVDIAPEVEWANEYDQLQYSIRVSPRLRINDHLFMVLRAQYSKNINNIGYVTDSLNNEELRIIFGERDIENITTTFSLNYSINTKFNFNFRLRHYYFKTDYDQYYDLEKDGNLTQTDYSGDDDFLYNAFNIDAYFSWLFAPGSELVLAWKNAIYTNQELPADSYFKELVETLQSPASNLISLKVLYYLDAQYFKRLKRKPDRQ
jgi:hypothetical protein